ncbi:hypothetical protein FBUS_10740 [Fasciolopsis buskii]|uniref:Uncharacterized protein n=1 Tax=Fasciolopsis buskii TaxID=27845 RepID=A0A8E0VIK1_9TREM|nr:hypothetical protein FBUS_10740 [Fasciolopsis buski]
MGLSAAVRTLFFYGECRSGFNSPLYNLEIHSVQSSIYFVRTKELVFYNLRRNDLPCHQKKVACSYDDTVSSFQLGKQPLFSFLKSYLRNRLYGRCEFCVSNRCVQIDELGYQFDQLLLALSGNSLDQDNRSHHRVECGKRSMCWKLF